ncbi:alpha/beta hydrolase [Brasilonema octagenarum UFV-E1]|uniref:Alpha/beta hydrolase n=1 Tax=Brasilonema sennae CENA114 TaxID=415709 RepID=A0A856MPM0_9CYAN|nr:alpha/beta hydrolase [Brasilonema sennae]QDL10936.1 alpha/beta hydrolase [Brasilonema sennae CENA114]QDL17282.1 alpha/beta hydrolase [Brasilonema octagenarum UFV-E1]
MTNDSFQDALAGSTIHLRRGVNLQVCHNSGRTPAIVFLHGGTGNRFNFRSQYEFAQSQGWEVLVYDLAGHGQSSPYPRYSIGRHCRDLRRLLYKLGISSPVLCCHSYGVPIGLEFAQHNCVSGFIAIAGGTHNLAPWWEIPLMKFMAWGGRYLYSLPGVQAISNFFSTSYRHSVIERFFAECPTPTDFQSYKALEIFWGYNFFTRHLLPQNLHIPALIITAGLDPMFTHQMGNDLARHFVNGTHLHVTNAGHLVMAECPELINSAILKYLIGINTQTPLSSQISSL